MTLRLGHTALCALAAAALAVAGCGGDDEGRKLPPGISEQLATTIGQIQDRVDANVSGACDDIFDGAAGGNFDETSQLIASIPEDVDPDIRSGLSESVDRLQELVSTECDEIQAREAEEQETVPEEETLPEETIPEETVPEETETETTPTETDTSPPPPQDDGKGNGQGPDGNGPPGQNDGGGLEVPE